jgi:hypothetical protein
MTTVAVVARSDSYPSVSLTQLRSFAEHRAAPAPILFGLCCFSITSFTSCIDCVTFEHLRTAEPALFAAVRVIGWSAASPGLPLITAAGTDDWTLAALRAALAEISADREIASALNALLIDGFDVLALDDYHNVTELERRAATLGYPELA